jgi:hypothetical protein
MFKGKVVALALMLVFATSIYAGDVDDCNSDCGVSCTGMTVSICPGGDFDEIRKGCGGELDYIWIEARDASNLPIPNIPWTDYWLNACDPTKQLWLCAQPIVADSLTGANGRTTFSGRIAAGGCTWHVTTPQGIFWAIQGKPILAKPCGTAKKCLAIIINGPDLIGASGPDGNVNLSDLVPFGAAYAKPPGNPAYNGCCDYNNDTFVNLSDFAFFGTHYTHHC